MSGNLSQHSLQFPSNFRIITIIIFDVLFFLVVVWGGGSVAQTYLNQKRLDAEAKQLLNGATSFHKQTQQWMHLIENFSSALKVFLTRHLPSHPSIFLNFIVFAFLGTR